MNTSETCKLISITDVRPIDWFTGKRLPLSVVENPPICERCGREHAIIWTVSTPRGIVTVGSGCGPRLLDGWNPEPFDLKEAKARMRADAEEQREAQLDGLAKPIADAVLALTMPEPTIAAEQPYPLVTVWEIGDAQKSIPKSGPRDTDWDQIQMRSAWIRSEITKLVNALYPLESDDYTDASREIRGKRRSVADRAKTLCNRADK